MDMELNTKDIVNIYKYLNYVEYLDYLEYLEYLAGKILKIQDVIGAK